MVPKKKIYIGARIVENDPEEPVSTPYRGRVIDIRETGKGEMDYYVLIRLDEESMRQPRVALCCPDGIMSCFPWAIDLEEIQKMERGMKKEKAPVLSKRHKLP